jgi:hypothetical protein
MPFDGNGNFTPATAPGYPAIAGTTILADQFNNVILDIASDGLTNCITRDGQSPATANIPMGNNKITGLANGTVATDAATLGQVQGATSNLLSNVAGTNTITADISPAITAYAAGQLFKFIPANDNTGAVTIAISGLVAKAITKFGTTALSAGDLNAGTEHVILYDGTQFQLLNPNIPYLGGTPTASIESGDLIPFLDASDGQTKLGTLSGIVVPNFITGLTFARNTGIASLTVQSGTCMDSTNTVIMTLAASITKTSAAWAVGTGNGGQDGSIPSGATGTMGVYWYLIRRSDTGVVDALYSLAPDTSSTVTITIASPGVITWTNHGLPTDGSAYAAPVKFTTTGALPTGLTAGTQYYVKTVLSNDTFTVSATVGGAVINTSGSQSGVHTAYSRPILPTSYDSYRRISTAIRTTGNFFLRMNQRGDYFHLGDGLLVASAVTVTSSTTQNETSMLPTGRSFMAEVQLLVSNSATHTVRVYRYGDTIAAPTIDDCNIRTAAAATNGQNTLFVATDERGEIGWIADSSTTGCYLQLVGWIDRRGQDGE